MRAVVVDTNARRPRLVDWPEPQGTELFDDVLLETLEVGLCGTDKLIVEGVEGEPPVGSQSLILGHEGLFRVVSAPPHCGIAAGQLAVTSVRWPDEVPCLNCRIGRPDLCSTGQWTEHGIRGRHGFLADYVVTEPDRVYAVPEHLRSVGVFAEPLSVVLKGLETLAHTVAERGGQHRRALVIGAGTIGLLTTCCLILAGYDVSIVDHARGSLKESIATDLGAKFQWVSPRASFERQTEDILRESDIVVDAAGVPESLTFLASCGAANSVFLMLGSSISPAHRTLDLHDMSARMVQENRVVIGSVNASSGHLRGAVERLHDITIHWPGLLDRCVRKVSPEGVDAALSRLGTADTVKIVVDFA